MLNTYFLLLVGAVFGALLMLAAAWVIRAKNTASQQHIVGVLNEQNQRLTQQVESRGVQIEQQRAEIQQGQLRAAASAAHRQESEQNTARLSQQLEAKGIELEQIRARELELTAQLSALETQLTGEKQRAQDQLKIITETREQLNAQFKTLANEIFEEKSRSMGDQNISRLDQLLKPLKERIKEFEQKVEQTYDKESKERFSLVKEIEKLQTLNIQISSDAVNLTKALRGESKTQGIWGEVVLERVLEKSGLVKGREYHVQVSMKTEEGKRSQPDVVIHLPEQRDVVIDSKVSLTAYERYCSVEDKAQQKKYLQLHIQSIRGHIRDLSGKDYQNLEGLRSLDFVLMFMPIEAAFTLALQEDQQLFQDAFDKSLIIVGPSTLLATLRTIQNIWRYENQTQNAQEIAKTAGGLYDKFVGLVTNLDELGERLDKTRDSYDGVVNKLSKGKGNLIRRTELLRELGANTSKTIPDKHLQIATEQPVITFNKDANKQ